MELKACHERMINNAGASGKERAGWGLLPMIRKVDAEDLSRNFNQVKAEVKAIVMKDMGKILGDAALAGFVVKRKRAPCCCTMILQNFTSSGN